MRILEVFCLFSFMLLTSAQRENKLIKPSSYHRSEDRAVSQGCANLTVVLDNWKYAIVTQVKDLLLNDHRSVLPDYGRIHPLSDALGDLYKEFNALKDRLLDLTSKLDSVEGFVDDIRRGRKPSALPGVHPLSLGQSSGGEAPPPVGDQGYRRGRRTRVVVRRVQRPAVGGEPGDI